MRNKKISIKLFSAIALTILISACDRNTNSLDGLWEDNIHLSAKTVQFTAGADSVIITTKGTWWWVCNVSVNGEYYHPGEDVDIESSNYTYTNNCFVVERRNNTTLFIKAAANTTGAKRIISVQLEAGDYFDAVTVTQAAQ